MYKRESLNILNKSVSNIKKNTNAILGIHGTATMMVILGIRGTVEMIAPGKKLKGGG